MTAASFSETADIETSSADYARRFEGAAGEWLLSVQERITLDLLRREEKGPLLEVGGGHGQLAFPLTREKWKVTVIGSDESCGSRIAPLIEAGRCNFRTGDLINLPFDADTFDHVLCFRFLSHCGNWQQLLRELCRVARKSVIIDYPPLLSWNLLTPVLFHLKKRLEGNTRTYTLFRHREIERVFREQGFSQFSRQGQFFLPMVVHRKLKNPELSEKIESPFRALGLTNLFGSPVILQARPK